MSIKWSGSPLRGGALHGEWTERAGDTLLLGDWLRSLSEAQLEGLKLRIERMLDWRQPEGI